MIKSCGDGIWEVRGTAAGKTVVILGGVHGNERTGVAVVEGLRAAFEAGEREVAAGVLYLVLGNPRAIAANVRFTEADLNRMFSVERLASESDGTYEDARARELAPILAAADIAIDLHATNKPSEPFVASLAEPHHRALFRWFDAGKVLADPRFILGGAPVTTDEYVERHGGAGVCYETGFAGDVSRAGVVRAAVETILVQEGVCAGHLPPTPENKQELFEMDQAIVLTDAGWRYAQGVGEVSFQPVAAGQTVGFHGETPLIASKNSVIVFPKIQEHWLIGKPVGYLASRVQ